MQFTKEISQVEIGILLIFFISYVLYLIRIQKVPIKKKYTSIYTKAILRILYFTFFIIALLYPSFGDYDKLKVKAISKDIFLLIDLSLSMNADDIAPSRLEKIKYESKNMIDDFTSDRIGLIIFSDEAYLQSPLTYDKNALKMFIETLTTGIISNSGTNFSSALRMALEKLSPKDGDLVSKQSAKIIVLISDGENFGEGIDKAINQLQSEEIKLFTVGVGTKKGAKIPISRGVKKNATGEEVITKLNDSDLKNMAKKTKGKYYQISDLKNEIPVLIHDIKEIKGEVRSEKSINANENKYFYFLLVGILLLILDILFRVKIFTYN